MAQDAERQHRIDAVCARLYEVSDRVAARFVGEFERFQAEGSDDARDPRLGFASVEGEILPDRAAIKYVLRARDHVMRKVRFLPFFDGVTSAFDIGVGPGHMFVLLQDALGIPTRGIDKEGFQGRFLYEALWQELGIADRISNFDVRTGCDVPIPEGTDAVLAFGPLFDKEWGADEHRWFGEMCRSHGARRIYWHFNSHTRYDVVLPYYRERGAQFPIEQEKGFCFLDL